MRDNLPMHTLITHAAPAGPQCQQALAHLALPHLAQLLQLLSPGERLRGRADDRTPIQERVLANAMGLTGDDGLVPWAAQDAQRLGLTGLHGPDGWAWVTPCHWDVHSDHVAMADPQKLSLTPKEVEALYLALQPYFAEDGITLFALPLNHAYPRWLAHGKVFVDLPTASLDRVAGHTVDAWMPRQAQAQTLRRLQNEMQMLLYTHTLNDHRASFQLPSVNAFWVSGTGTLQGTPSNVQQDSVASVRDALRIPALNDDAAGWASAWHALDATTLAHDLERLQHGEAVQLTLCGEAQALTLTAQPLSTWERLRRRFTPPSVHDLLKNL